MRLLIVEDDEILVQTLEAALTERHYVVNVAQDGEEGWDYAQTFDYDLMLLDVSLPKLDGIRLCQRLRDHQFRNPILLLTARDSSADKVAGLDAGADDYVVKPCTIPELLARIRALLRRRSAAGSPILHWGELSFDPSSCEVKWQSQTLTLSPKELSLLELLLRHPMQVFTKGAILEHLWSFDDPPSEDTVRAHIKGLRRKLKKAGATDVVETVYGVGYRLREAPEDPDLPAETTAPESSATVESATELSSKADQTRTAVAQLWQQFKAPILARLATLEAAIAALKTDQLTEELRLDAESQAHKLVGSLGMYGMTEGSDAARQLEQNLAPGVSPTDCEALSETLQALRDTFPLETETAPSESEVEAAIPAIATISQGKLPITPTTPKIWLINPDQTYTAEVVAEAAQWDLQIEAFHTIAAAQAAIATTQPDLICLALVFPDDPQGGLTFLEFLTETHGEIPVLVLTATDHFRDRVAVARLGGQGFLNKSLTPAQVLMAVTQNLQQTKAPEAKLMAVDDDALLLHRLGDYLTPWGFSLQTVNDSRQFWQELQGFQPDLLILDVEMPHINGIELCQVVRNDPTWSGLPIIFLSANRDRETLQRIYEVGADDFINKPVTEPELVTRILNRLERSQLLQAIAEKDPLTHVANRSASERAFRRFITAAEQEQMPFCLGIVEVNQLRLINVQYGHEVGDRVLQRFGQLLQQALSREDIIARWSGSEFILGLYGLDLRAAQTVVFRVLQLLEQEIFLLEENITLHLTLRGAIACYPEHGQHLRDLYQQADHALRKVERRDRTCLVTA